MWLCHAVEPEASGMLRAWSLPWALTRGKYPMKATSSATLSLLSAPTQRGRQIPGSSKLAGAYVIA
jgi:hypothetical protein